MTELVKALTELALEGVKYLKKLQGEAAGEGPAAQPAEPKPPKKTKVKEPAAETAPPPAAAAPELTDKESYDELCRLAIAYIAADKPGSEARRAEAMTHVAATYKADALSKVEHGPNRVQLILWFKERLSKAATAPAPSGFGV